MSAGYPKVTVYAEDMTDEMMHFAMDKGREAFLDQKPNEKNYVTIATRIRHEHDKAYGKHWNCVVGTSFGSYVTHEIKTYIYYSVAGTHVLLWKM